MSRSLEKKYPPYAGNEPFLFLCFSHEDAQAVEPLLSRLWQRGVRVWYTTRKAKTVAEEKQLQSRMKESSFVAVYCTPSFLTGPAKARMMFLQSRNIPIVAIDAVPTDNLSGGFKEGTLHIPAMQGITEETEIALITADGFSQDLMGARRKPPLPDFLVNLFRFVLILLPIAVLIPILLLSGVIHPKRSVPPEELTVLELSEIPDDLSELEQYPNLEKILIPQSEAEKALSLMDRYTIVLKGED